MEWLWRLLHIYVHTSIKWEFVAGVQQSEINIRTLCTCEIIVHKREHKEKILFDFFHINFPRKKI